MIDVGFWDGWKSFSDNPTLQTVEEYLKFFGEESGVCGRRGERIKLEIRKDD